MNIDHLKLITDKLETTGIDYAVGGSGLLHCLGLFEVVNDWDITVECGLDELKPIFSNFEWSVRSSGDYPFASQYRIHIPQLNIDLMGSFALNSGSGIVHLPVKQSMRWNGVKMGSPEVWYVAYKLMHRENKAELLYNYLKTSGPDGAVIKELLGDGALNEDLRVSLLALVEQE